jgi:hypothetical protein
MADGDDDGGNRKKLGVRELARRAGGELEQLLGRPVSSVLGVKKEDDNWNVTLEIVEVDRIPETTSIMGVYRVVLDEDGDVLEYARTRRYHRGQPSEDG